MRPTNDANGLRSAPPKGTGLARQSEGREPFFDDGQAVLYLGNCVEVLGELGLVDCVVTDPPYGDTSLVWDRTPDPYWLDYAANRTSQLWCFGSMRFWLGYGDHFRDAGWRYGQEIVWEKHNGSGFQADRFRRVHELAVHWYRGAWDALHHEVPLTLDAAKRTVRKRGGPVHTGAVGPSDYATEDGGPRLMRSVLQVRSENSRAVHPTQKPLGILRPLITFSCPVDGIVLDPFAGSGSTLVAARDLGRRSIGIEAREDYCEAAVKRLAQGVMAG